ncbi:MAG TPA: FHA domain-containing protein, partial [Gemmataceae bacterium]
MPVSWEWWLLAGGGLACLLVLLLLRVPRRVGRRLPGPPGPAPPFAAEPETPRRPELVLVAAPPDGAPSWVVVPLGEGELVLGRNRELCQVHFPHRAVSGTHARIRRRDGRWHLEDLHSKNHTYLNKERVTTAVPLRAGDLIEFSGYALRFEPGAAERGAGDPTVMDSRVEAALGPLSSRQVLEAQREEGLAALLEIAEDLGRHLEVSELLPRVAERLLALFRRADRCLVLRWVPADEQFRAEQVRGRGAQPPRECFSQTIARRCL